MAKIAENATDYSLQNTLRRALFLPTSREAKYKALQAVETFFWRAGDMLSALAVLIFIRALQLPLQAFAVVNILARRSSGSGSRRSWRARTAASPPSPSASPHDSIRLFAYRLLTACRARRAVARRRRAGAGAADAGRGAAAGARGESQSICTPPEPARLERCLLDLEAGRLFERLLNPAEGLYPKFGTITAGSGFSIGPGYRKTQRLGGAIDFSTLCDGVVQEVLAGGRARPAAAAARRTPRASTSHVQTLDFREELFFGLGPDSARSDLVNYGIAATPSSADPAALRPASWLTVSRRRPTS